MSQADIDLKGNTNFVVLKDLNEQVVVPRTNLAAVDMTVANGLNVTGNTMSVKLATADDITSGTTGSLISPDVIKPILDAKQGNLAAGSGIDITSGTISTANVPQAAVTGLSASLAAKQDNMTAGYRNEIISGTTIAQQRYFDIESPSGSTVTLQAGHAYKIQATTAAKTLTAETVPSNKFGLEGHAEIFLAGPAYIHTDSSVVLATPLEPDSVNNCTVRFHDGLAIISVEDHVAGYIVVSATGTTAGTLSYALTSATQEYVAFDATLNGQTLDLAGATTYAGEKHVVGNGYTETILSGGITCTSKTTFSNLSMDGVVFSGGTGTLGDVYIPNGSTVAVSGGGKMLIEKATGNGGTIDLNGSYQGYIDKKVDISGLKFTGGTVFGTNGGAFVVSACEFTECYKTGSANGICMNLWNGTIVTLKDSYIHGNTITSGQRACNVGKNSVLKISGSTITDTLGVTDGTGKIVFAGSNSFTSYLTPIVSSGTVELSSGAILDLTGNTNATPIAPGGGISFASGGATVLYSSGAVSGSYMMDNVTLPAGAKLTNTAVVDLNSASVQLTSATTISASGATFANGSATSKTVDGTSNDLGGVIYLYSTQAKARFEDCTFTGGNASFGGICTVKQGSAGGFTREPDAVFSNCIMSGNRATIGGCIAAMNGGYVKLTGCSATNNRVSGGGAPFFANGGYLWFDGLTGNNFTVLRGGSARLKITSNNKFESDITGDAGGGIVTIESDAVIDLTGNSNAAPINPVGGVVVADGDSTKSATIINSAGVEVAIVGGTYSKIKNDGTTA